MEPAITALASQLAVEASKNETLQQENAQLKAELEKLRKEVEHRRTAMEEHLGLDPQLSPYHQMRSCQPIGKALAHYKELEEVARANGYKSLATQAFGASKAVRYENVPSWLRTPPTHWISTDHYEKELVWVGSKRVERNRHVKGVTGPKAQKQLEKLWPVINGLLNDPNIDTEDINQLRTLYLSLSYEEFANELYKIRANEEGLQSIEVEAEPQPAVELTLEEQTALLARLQPDPNANYVPIHDD